MARITAFAEFELMTEALLPSRLIDAVLIGPKSWNRLEPQSRSGNPAPGASARLHDPLWLMGRQWQFGEFLGEDCGTPLSVEVTAQTRRVTGFRAGGPNAAAAPEHIGPDSVIEPEIEREPWAPPPLRDRAEATAALLAALTAQGWSDETALREACPFDLDAPDIAASIPPPEWVFIASRTADAERIAEALEAGATPDWMAGANAAAKAAAATWLDWYRRNVSPKGKTAESWLRERLEYRFALRAGPADAPAVLSAPRHEGGAIDWHSFDLTRDGDFLADAAADTETHKAITFAGRLRYAGMPADRFWQFEDGRVNFGVTDVQPNDLARIALLEFATVYGNDWLIAPIDLPRGSLVDVTEVAFTTTFGERIAVLRANDVGRSGRFALFATTAGDATSPTFLVPPGGRTAIEGPVREEVVFARDEAANIAWAIELRVEGADGLGRDRAREPQVLQPAPVFDGAGDLVYRLETEVPPWWIPLVPIPTGTGGFFLRKGSFTDEDGARGHVLAPTPFDVKDEEIPREGVRVRRAPCLMRDDKGALVRWITRRVGPAGGEAASRLAYDNAFKAP